MRKLLLSTLIAAGLTLVGVSSFAVDVIPQDVQMGQKKQDTKQGVETLSETTGTFEGEEYVVQEGDTLSEIAKEFLGSEEEWRLIAKANDIENPDKIIVGQRLHMPSTQNNEMSAEMEQQTNQVAAVEITADITGQITAINGDILSVTDKVGKTHLIKITDPETLERIKVGDNVNIKIEKGLALSIKKTESKSAEFAP